MAFDYLRDLNAEQRRAVEYGVKPGSAYLAGPLLVIAGAGTGKTKTLTYRVAHLIVNGISPHRILLLTFTRRAAGEMTRRVIPLPYRPESETSVSICLQRGARHSFVNVIR